MVAILIFFVYIQISPTKLVWGKLNSFESLTQKRGY